MDTWLPANDERLGVPAGSGFSLVSNVLYLPGPRQREAGW